MNFRGIMASKRKYWLACGVAISTLPALPAAAQPRSIDIPSEEAARSIPEFARQENIQIIAPVSQLHGIKTPAVSGNMNLDEALKTLLVGTGLEVASDDGATVVLRRAVAATPVTDVDSARLCCGWKGGQRGNRDATGKPVLAL